MLGIVRKAFIFRKKITMFSQRPLNEFKLASKIGYDFIEFLRKGKK